MFVMKMNKTLLALAVITSTFTMNAMAVEQKNVELQFDPSTVEIISVDQLESPRALKSEGVIQAFASAGAWTKVVYNPSLYTAGQWYLGPVMSAPAGTSPSAIVQNITWQWNIWNYNSNLTTYLCESTLSQCVNISGNFGAGANLSTVIPAIPANRSWRYAFYYAGSGTISPALIGQNGSIAVTYQ
tara:strand:- start:837 stop:1394 length:558 start_codon:yes stop_codon:yes gene_type:complete